MRSLDTHNHLSLFFSSTAHIDISLFQKIKTKAMNGGINSLKLKHLIGGRRLDPPQHTGCFAAGHTSAACIETALDGAEKLHQHPLVFRSKITAVLTTVLLPTI